LGKILQCALVSHNPTLTSIECANFRMTANSVLPYFHDRRKQFYFDKKLVREVHESTPNRSTLNFLIDRFNKNLKYSMIRQQKVMKKTMKIICCSEMV